MKNNFTSQPSSNQAKMFVVKFVCSVLSVWIFLFAASEVIDPYGENQNQFLEYNFNARALTARKLKSQLKENDYTLVFGTSRSRLLSEKLLGESVINLHAIYGTPFAVINFLKQLSPQELRSVRKIYYLLDVHTFQGKKDFEPIDSYDNPLQGWLFKLKKFDRYVIFAAWEKLIKNMTGTFDFYVDDHGYSVLMEDKAFNDAETTAVEALKTEQESILKLAEVDRFCRQHGIDIIYYTSPFEKTYLTKWHFNELALQRKLFLQAIEGYYDFTYVPEISNDTKNFYDVSHLNLTGFSKFLPLFDDKDKYFVTLMNIDSHMKNIHEILQSKVK